MRSGAISSTNAAWTYGQLHCMNSFRCSSLVNLFDHYRRSSGRNMGTQGFLLELLLTGFFAIACTRARTASTAGNPMKFGDLLSFRGRIERLQRSRWQWCSIVVLLIIARLQWGLPMFVEITFAALLALFLAIPSNGDRKEAMIRR